MEGGWSARTILPPSALVHAVSSTDPQLPPSALVHVVSSTDPQLPPSALVHAVSSTDPQLPPSALMHAVSSHISSHIMLLHHALTSCGTPTPSDAQPLRAVDKLWHPDCFVCGECGVSLKEQPFFSKNDIV